MVFSNFTILDGINKFFIRFLRLLNKSLYGIPPDHCVWGFTESVIHSLVTSQLKKRNNKKKNFVKGKNWLFSSRNVQFFPSPQSPSFLSLQFTLMSLFFSDYLQFCFHTFLLKWNIPGPKRTNFIPLQLLKITTPNRKGEFNRSESAPNIISTKAEKENVIN